MSHKRVLLLAGLSSIHTIRWANVLAEQGYDVHLVSQQAAIDALDERVTVYRRPDRGSLGYFLMVPFVRKLVKRLKPAVINAHYASGYGTTARLSGAPFMLSVWGSDVYKFPYRSKLHHYLVRKNIMAATLVASTSQAMAEQIRAVAPKVKRLVLTPFGVDMSAFTPVQSSQEAPAEPIVIGTVKGLTPLYGVDILIRAFAAAKKQRPNVPLQLRIVGDGPLKAELEHLVQQQGIAKITDFVGRVPHSQVPNQLRQLDVYVALSRSESFGVAVLEASACGVPVLVSNVGGLPEVVIPGETGHTVPGDNADAATEALLDLIDSKTLRQEMGAAGVRFVQEHYSWHVCVDKFCQALTEQQRLQQSGKQ